LDGHASVPGITVVEVPFVVGWGGADMFNSGSLMMPTGCRKFPLGRSVPG
jgi:hypothetical protein